MRSFFADTFFWIALADSRDIFHRRAVEIVPKHRESIFITTDEVLSEYLTFFADSPAYIRNEIAGSVFDILGNPGIRVIPQSRQSFLAGLELYAQRADKGYSLTDCTSMWTMRLEGITEVLTNDCHFEQEGFHALFRHT